MSEKEPSYGFCFPDAVDQSGWLRRRVAVGVDLSCLDPTPTSVTHSCARCDTVLLTTSATLPDDAVESMFDAHGKVCERRALEVGDWVHVDAHCGGWAEGMVISTRTRAGHHALRPSATSEEHSASMDAGEFTFRPGVRVRRIPRPVDEVKTPVYDTGCNHVLFDGAAVFDIRHEYGQRVAWCGACGDALDAPPRAVETPVLHDGMSTMECYRKWYDNRALVERGGPPLYTLTPAQISAGRATYLSDALSEHSAELRAKVEAAKERERLQVVVDQDGEVGEW